MAVTKEMKDGHVVPSPETTHFNSLYEAGKERQQKASRCA
jgi:hypothetical protein